ncbi:ABC transporter permease [Streptomyces sp. AM 4-1-1]|uniref:FtsX-like permease family protein n=1 Tax=Streptomyces sp. AM 4-1-1 TaxID=3028710 RepID=UPI0023B92159|nr:FtsX-like permease family protein [Streptomyces sp. AM 4-1-1]WEH35624.1 ABC transporter permease [Streptomyces sp. AM 4-1-1]
MTLLEQRDAPAGRRPASPAASSAPAWLRDLLFGARFAVSGGREGWTRTLLTAVGVGLGVALLLGAASAPTLMAGRHERATDRLADGKYFGGNAERSDSTLLWQYTGTEFRDRSMEGRLVKPDGAHPVLPPGVSAIPAPGELVVSPALRDLLGSSEGALLRERLNGRIIGTIGKAGLVSPGEFYYYAGSDTLSVEKDAQRTAVFGSPGPAEDDPMDPALIALIALICVVLLTPIAIFISTAVRFGGDQRDRRLAALRLIGADARSVRRIAAGESMCGSVLGVVIGAGIFLGLRRLSGSVELLGLSAFPGDLTPVPALAALILCAVPVCAVAVTLLSLRSVAIEPLGVVRNAVARRRKLWWRVLLPVAGAVVLLTQGRMNGPEASVRPVAIVTGATLLLFGLVTLLPWLVEAVVSRLRGGPVPWQLAVRRLQLTSSGAARAISGITVAVAGAIALQLLFGAMNGDFTTMTNQDPHRAQMNASIRVANGTLAQEMIDKFRATKGVTGVIGTIENSVSAPGPKPVEERPNSRLVMGTCTTLRELATLDRCEDGDTFLVRSGDEEVDQGITETVRPGRPLDLTSWEAYEKPDMKQDLWTVPKDIRTATARTDPGGDRHEGIFVTPSALDVTRLPGAETTAMLQVDPSVPDAEEYVRNTAAAIDPGMNVMTFRNTVRDRDYASIQTGLQLGATLTMVLIAVSMLVTMLEQLRERRKLLAALAAFGTRRSAIAWSVLWQTTIPVVLGLALAVVGGLGLGAVMARLVGDTVQDWFVFLPLTAVGGGLVLAVTLLSLPPLWRMMRPDGLRTE